MPFRNITDLMTSPAPERLRRKALAKMRTEIHGVIHKTNAGAVGKAHGVLRLLHFYLNLFRGDLVH